MVKFAFPSSIRIIGCERMMVAFGRIRSIWALSSNNSFKIVSEDFVIASLVPTCHLYFFLKPIHLRNDFRGREEETILS